MNPKIARDPYFRTVAERWGDAAAFEGGFFLDQDPDDASLDDVGWLCTPTRAVRRLLAGRAPRTSHRPPVVLLSTGGFFPVHDGHLAMMETARSAAVAHGYDVVGGYLSPGHDDYIALKCGGTVTVGASDRIAAAVQAIASAGASWWLAVDPWESTGRRVAVNFTDVCARLRAYLRHHVDAEIDVLYVCGGDNARFMLAFVEDGGCIVVGRPGFEDEVERWRSDDRIAGHRRVLFVAGDDASASSAMRDDVRPPNPPSDVQLRMEDAVVVARLGIDAPAWRRFQDQLADRLSTHLPVRLASPPAASGRRVPGDDLPVISLDPLVKGDADLRLSRLFELGGYHRVGHVARPGSAPVDDQLAAIPPGRWRLLDDDRSTGDTARWVCEHLPPGVEIVTTTFSVENPDGEIADSRDFLIGTADGGLVVELPDGSIGRVPYLLPYVDPSVRCGVPASDALRFSRDVWRFGAAVHDVSGRTVADLDPAARAVLRLAGHPADARLSDVCRHHADVLDALVPHALDA